MEKQVEILMWEPGMKVYSGKSAEAKMQADQWSWYDKSIMQINNDWRRMLFHVDNNSWNSIIGAQKASLGVIKGPSDFVFISFGETIYIENKIPGGVQEKEQIDFMNKVLARGQRYVLNYALETFKRFIMKEIAKYEY